MEVGMWKYETPWDSDDEYEEEVVQVPEGAEEVFRVEVDGDGPEAERACRAVKSGRRYWAVFPPPLGPDGPFNTLAKAIVESGLCFISSNCRRVWSKPREIATRELLDALDPIEDDELRVEINGKRWVFRGGGWRCAGWGATPPAWWDQRGDQSR
jgi:hypothetical protein